MTTRFPATLCAWMAIGAACSAALQAQGPGSAEVSLNKGIEAFTSEDYASARRYFEATVALEPDFAAGHYFLGLTLMQTASRRAEPAVKKALLERALAEFEQSRLRDPEMVLAYLDGAVAQTILGRFDDAESGFHKFVAARPDEPLPYLFLAVVHYRQAKEDAAHLPRAIANLDKAEAALARAEERDRSLESHVKFYRGLVYLRQKNPRAARSVLQEGFDLAPDSQIGRQSKELLDRMARRRPWDLSLQMGFDYDTNLTLRGRHVPRAPREAKGSDCRFGLGSAFTYRIIDDEEVLVGVGGSTFHTWHGGIDEFNVQNYAANLYVAYTPSDIDWLTVSCRYDWDYTYVGNESFLARQRVTPQIDIETTSWANTTLFYQFDVRDYLGNAGQPAFDRDGDTHSLGVIQSFRLGEHYDRPVTAELSYRFENVDTRGTEFSSENHLVALRFELPLPDDFTFDLLASFEAGYYKNASLFDRRGSRRRDYIRTFGLGLTKQFTERLSARFQVDVVDDNSNTRDRLGQQFFTYNRAIYGLSLLYRF